MKKIIIVIIVTLIFYSCGVNRKTQPKNEPIINQPPTETVKNDTIIIENKVPEVTPEQIFEVKPNKTTQQYIEKYASIAMQKMKMYKIPASITLAQGILESGSGNSTLAVKANNHFGIKCHEWQGEKIYHDDDAKGECFRVYRNPEGSFEDHSIFLTTRSRYAKLFQNAPNDYFSWAYGLSAAGYATDKKYPQKLIAFIEKYNLKQYDDIVMAQLGIEIPKKEDYYIVQKGDVLYGIANKYNISVEDLKKRNQLTTDDLYIGQRLKITETIQNNADKTQEITITDQQTPVQSQMFHTVALGETLFSIAKNYGKTVDEIKAINALQTDALQVGQILRLEAQSEVEDSGVENQKTFTIDEIIPEKKEVPDFHIVQKGENLYQIAYQYDLEITFIRKINRLNKDEITIGQKILLKEVQSSINVYSAKTYIVQKGDTLYAIAKKTNVPIDKIISLNHIQNNKISVGQQLLLE